MVLSCLSVSELGEIQSWEAAQVMRQEAPGLRGGFPCFISNNYSCKLLSFFSSGNAALSFVNKISGLITVLQVTGGRPHHCWKAWAAPPGAGEADKEGVSSTIRHKANRLGLTAEGNSGPQKEGDLSTEQECVSSPPPPRKA